MPDREYLSIFICHPLQEFSVIDLFLTRISFFLNHLSFVAGYTHRQHFIMAAEGNQTIIVNERAIRGL